MRFTALPTRLLTVACLLLFVAAVPAEAQKRKINATEIRDTGIVEIVPEAEAANLDQCRNGGIGEPVIRCNEAEGGWVNGNAGPENAHWAEDQYLTYRMRMSDLTIGSTNTLVIGYDILKSGTHAIDYLGTYNKTATDADPCTGVAGCVFANSSTFNIPKDTTTVHGKINPNTGLPIVQEDGVFTIWGGTITAVNYVNYAGGEERQIAITFTANTTNPVIAWGGHIAWVGDWGPGNSAGSIGGSPYHMRLIGLNGRGGNQDRSLKSEAVIPSGAIIIIKAVETLDNQDRADVFFPFTASASFNPLNFQLKDMNDGVLDRTTSLAITAFGPANAVTVTEGPSGGFDLIALVCSESGLGDTTINLPTRTATISVNPLEVVTCTFTNGLLVPSAAPASVTGRVTDRFGRGISAARVQIFDVMTGEVKVAATNSFGYYRFDELEVGNAYMVNVSHRLYRFSAPTTTFTLDGDLAGIDFVAN